MMAGPSPGAAFDVGAWLSVLGIEQYETEGVTLTRRHRRQPLFDARVPGSGSAYGEDGKPDRSTRSSCIDNCGRGRAPRWSGIQRVVDRRWRGTRMPRPDEFPL